MRPGDLLGGRFELEELAASGGMGEVFRARDRLSGAIVAVKMLLAGRGPETARFEREAKVLADLSHPGIVRYVAHGVTPKGEPYLAMEWLEGEDLFTRLGRRSLTIDESVAIAMGVAEALGAAHARGVVHRDLKPTNLFLVSGDPARVKLLDFGIAQLGGGTRVTQAGALIGTPGYMAPEQVRGEGPADARADVFSLGCVLFECIAGKPAFSGDHLMAVLAKVLLEDPPLLHAARPEVSAGLSGLVARMLAKSPSDRPANGDAVKRALGAIASGDLEDLAPPPPSIRRPAALTNRELVALSVVLIGAERPDDVAGARTLETSEVASTADAIRREVEAFGGRIEPMSGGAALVTLVGVGVAKDQAAQAARLAIALRRHAKGRPIALSTGGGQVTAERLPVGDAIDRAVRMLSAIPKRRPGDPDEAPIAIDELTAGLLDDRFGVREGEAGLVLVAERDLAEGARTLLGRPTACVGRDRELAMLEQTFAECVDEPTAQEVLITAPAGVGKSRLAHEFLRSLERRGEAVSIWIGRGDSLRAGSAFGLLGQAIRGACGILEGEPLEVRRDKLLARVGDHVDEGSRKRVAEFLGELIGAPFSDEGSVLLREARKDAQVMSDQLRMAWEDFVRAEVSVRPVLLVLEDLHWGDQGTARFVDEALRSLRNKPFMVLSVARPEVHELFPRLRIERGVQEIRLKELSRRASERLVRQALGEGVSPARVERLVTQADGNAFYLEELIRATAERRGEALPETVVAMVQSRLSALPSDARRVLRAASVFGEVFWPGAVAALLGGAGELALVREALSELTLGEVVTRRRESRFPEEEELAFRHALLREGAYAMLTEQDRVLGHKLAGAWLSGHGEAEPLVLAEHFEQGKEPAKAGGHYLRAAEQALAAGDTAAAILRAKRGLTCGIPEPLRVELLGVLCEAHGWRIEWNDAALYAEEVMRLAAPGSGPWARGVLAKLMETMYHGKREAFLAAVGALKDVTPAPDAIVPMGMALHYAAFYLAASGQVAAAHRFLRRMHAVIEPVAESEPMALGMAYVADAYLLVYAREEVGKSWVRVKDGKARMVEAGFRRGADIARMFTGMLLWLLGAFDEAARELHGMTSDDRSLGPMSSVRWLSLAGARMDAGDLKGAKEVAADLVTSGRIQGIGWREGRGLLMLAEVLRREGDLEGAEASARRAVERLAVLPLEQTAAAATLAAVHLAAGRVDQALSASREAMARYKDLGACGFFRGQYLRVVHAESLAAAGEEEAARAAIAEARDHLFEQAATIGDVDFRRSFLENVPENARTIDLARRWLGATADAVAGAGAASPD